MTFRLVSLQGIKLREILDFLGPLETIQKGLVWIIVQRKQTGFNLLNGDWHRIQDGLILLNGEWIVAWKMSALTELWQLWLGLTEHTLLACEPGGPYHGTPSQVTNRPQRRSLILSTGSRVRPFVMMSAFWIEVSILTMSTLLGLSKDRNQCILIA